MTRTLTDEDINAVAARVISLISERLTTTAPEPVQPPTPVAKEPTIKEPRLTYTLKQLGGELNVSPATLYRLEARGLIRPLQGIRRKIYTHKEVERFLSETQAGSWK